MKSNYLTFDYHIGTIRRDLLREGRKTIISRNASETRPKKGSIVNAVTNLFKRAA